MTEYDFPFTREKQIKEQITGVREGEEEPKTEEITEEPKTEEIKEEPKTEEIKEEPESKKEKSLLDKLKGTTIDLSSVDEGVEGAATKEDRQLLEGFKMLNVKFHLLAGDLCALRTKSKYRNLFDGGVLSMQSANNISPELSELFKDKSRVFVESADYLIALKPE